MQPFFTPRAILDGKTHGTPRPATPWQSSDREQTLLAGFPNRLASCEETPSLSHSGTRCPNTECNIAKRGKKLGKRLWELISVLSNSWRAPGHGVSDLTKLPWSHWFYIIFGSGKSSKAFKFCFPSSSPLGSKITRSKGLLCFTQAWEQLAIFFQNPFFKVFLVYCFLLAVFARHWHVSASSLMKTSHLWDTCLESDLCHIILIKRKVVGNFIPVHRADYPSQTAALVTSSDPAALMCVCIKQGSPTS